MSSSKQMSPGMQFFFTRIFPLPFIIIGALTLYFGGRSLWRAKESMTWPMVDGRIQNSEVRYRSGSKGGGTYHAEVLYTFAVDGKTHSGNMVAFGDYGTSNPSHARDIVERYPKDKAVNVWYLPADPDVCVLEPGRKGQAWAWPAIGLLFLVMGALMAIFLPRFAKTAQRAAPW